MLLRNGSGIVRSRLRWTFGMALLLRSSCRDVFENEESYGPEARFSSRIGFWIAFKEGENWKLWCKEDQSTGAYYWKLLMVPHEDTGLEKDSKISSRRSDTNFSRGCLLRMFQNGNIGIATVDLPSVPENICYSLPTERGTGVCGYNRICRLSIDKRPDCQCPRAFSLVDPDDDYKGCIHGFVQDCADNQENAGNQSKAEKEFETEVNVMRPNSSQEFSPFNGILPVKVTWNQRTQVALGTSKRAVIPRMLSSRTSKASEDGSIRDSNVKRSERIRCTRMVCFMPVTVKADVYSFGVCY
ncbi:hypothetical protein HAX54_045010 [Datura stramonium]|uniref:Uncharacterized protein n=1 Tax=Datura stramonium TaxID=4076 RepID=A0ABS8WFB0_DATST|nr:hypothetical protein [Datura stramonium]